MPRGEEMTCAASSSVGADDGTRTRNRRFTKPLLYQLSYVGGDVEGYRTHARSVQRRPLDLVRRRSTATGSVAGFGGPARHAPAASAPATSGGVERGFGDRAGRLRRPAHWSRSQRPWRGEPSDRVARSLRSREPAAAAPIVGGCATAISASPSGDPSAGVGLVDGGSACAIGSPAGAVRRLAGQQPRPGRRLLRAGQRRRRPGHGSCHAGSRSAVGEAGSTPPRAGRRARWPAPDARRRVAGRPPRTAAPTRRPRR